HAARQPKVSHAPSPLKVAPRALQPFAQADVGAPSQLSLDLGAVEVRIAGVARATGSALWHDLASGHLKQDIIQRLDARGLACANVVGLAIAGIEHRQVGPGTVAHV